MSLEKIDYNEDIDETDDFTTIMADFFMDVNYKLIFFLFLSFIFVSSDVFIDKVLGRFDSAAEHRNATSKGTVIQGIFLVLMYIISDLIIKLEVV